MAFTASLVSSTRLTTPVVASCKAVSGRSSNRAACSCYSQGTDLKVTAHGIVEVLHLAAYDDFVDAPLLATASDS
jgi:hypothetical protein